MGSDKVGGELREGEVDDNEVVLALVKRAVQEAMAEQAFADKTIGAMTVEAFTRLMVSVMETRHFAQAEKEAEVSARIFKDATGIATVAQPWRVMSAREAQATGEMIGSIFKTRPKAKVVISMAILTEAGEYEPLGRG